MQMWSRTWRKTTQTARWPNPVNSRSQSSGGPVDRSQGIKAVKSRHTQAWLQAGEEICLRQFHAGISRHACHCTATRRDACVLRQVPDRRKANDVLARRVCSGDVCRGLFPCRRTVTLKHCPRARRCGNACLVEDRPCGCSAPESVSFTGTVDMNEQGHDVYFASPALCRVETSTNRRKKPGPEGNPGRASTQPSTRSLNERIPIVANPGTPTSHFTP